MDSTPPRSAQVSDDPQITPNSNHFRPPLLSPPPIFTSPLQQGIPSPLIRTPTSNLIPPINGPMSGSPLPHLSTPPGPPIFTSPVRPAAVPFRASPVTPQPIAYSSNSSLPTSLSNFSNGSPEPQQHVSFSSSDTFSVEDSPLVHFSSSKVLRNRKQMNLSSLGFGALLSPGREITTGPQIIQRNPHRCSECGAYSNVYCKILLGSGQWQCVVCKTLNSSDGEYIAHSKEELLTFPELSTTMVDYIKTGNTRLGFLPSDSRVSVPVILVIDECLDEPHLQHLQSSLHAFVDSLPPSARIGIITYGSTVSVYDFSEESMASADVLPGDKSLDQETLSALLCGSGVYLSPMHASKEAAHLIFSSLRPYRSNRVESSRDRCLGEAVEVALAIAQGVCSEASRAVIKRPGGNNRVIVCAGGPNTYGPGSVPGSLTHPNYAHLESSAIQWMDRVGREARRRNTVVDILCGGNCPVRVPVLRPLAESSGGVLMIHDDFGEAFGVNLQRASSRASGANGLLEIRCSDDVGVSQVIGPCEEADMDSNNDYNNDRALSLHLHSVEESQCFAVVMETKRDVKSACLFFQFVVRYSSIYQAEISRVITVRLPTIDSVSEYLQSVKNEVLAVIIAKKALLRAATQFDALQIRDSVDERIKDLALKLGSHVSNSKLIRFPKELSSLPELLFHLRRGPLLGSIVGHEDERSVLRNLFLNAEFDLSLRMVAPRCLMHQEGGTFEEVPAYDLAMQSNKAVVLDHGTDIFIWMGAELSMDEARSAAALAACKTLAEELTETRFPAPRILSFKEGSSQARYFVARLIPAHKDPPYEQESRFPQLASLGAEERAKLKSSFIHFDEPSFCEWMRTLKLLPPEPSL